MNWKKDKVKHYKLGFKFGRYGSILGFIIVAILAAGKEITDYFRKNHVCEMDDFKASMIGAIDGVLFRKERFKLG